MSEDLNYYKDFGPDDAVRERTGIYAFGFSMASFLGFLVPGAIVFLFQPRRSSAFGAPPSIIHVTTSPLGPLTST